MNWHLDVNITGTSTLVDTDGTEPPQRLSGDVRTLIDAINVIVPSDAPITMDTTGVGLAVAQELVRLGRSIRGYTLRPVR